MAKKSVTSDVIKLPNVRLSFARLYVPKAFNPGQEPRFEATFLLDPSKAEHAAVIKNIKTTAAKIAKEAFGELPKGLEFKALYDGNSKSYDGYANMWALASHNKVRPTVVNRSRAPVQEGDTQAPYSGCYVNGSITLWVQDNQYGKRINVNLRAVQFVQDGPAFGTQAVSAEAEFEALEDSDSLEADPFA